MYLSIGPTVAPVNVGDIVRLDKKMVEGSVEGGFLLIAALNRDSRKVILP